MGGDSPPLASNTDESRTCCCDRCRVKPGRSVSWGLTRTAFTGSINTLVYRVKSSAYRRWMMLVQEHILCIVGLGVRVVRRAEHAAPPRISTPTEVGGGGFSLSQRLSFHASTLILFWKRFVLVFTAPVRVPVSISISISIHPSIHHTVLL